MATEEKFNQIYQTIVSENTEDMEIARGEARVENRHNMFVLAIIIIINIVFIKLIGDSLEALSARFKPEEKIGSINPAASPTQTQFGP